MAQADANLAINLQEAILNVKKFPPFISEDYDAEGYLLPQGLAKRFIKKPFLLSMINDYGCEPLFHLDDILFSGSITEGTFLISSDKKASSDIDLMLVLKHIKITEVDQKKGNLVVKENTPFVNFCLTNEDLIKNFADCLETSSDAIWERAKLSSKKLQMRFIEKCPLSSILTVKNQDGVQVFDEGPSIPLFAKLRIPMFNHIPVHFDFVLAIKCNGWPLCAQEWIFRPRCWPSPKLVRTIVKEGFHIVCKSSPEGDFRLSYSTAETLLIGNLSNLQFKTYRAFKSFVSHYKKNMSPNAKKTVCSYHLKTIFLWYCEKSDPIDWTKDRIAGHLLSLIDDLILALHEKNLPMYFMPKYNLMEQFEVTTEALKQMTELRFNINLITEAIITEERNVTINPSRELKPETIFMIYFMLNKIQKKLLSQRIFLNL